MKNKTFFVVQNIKGGGGVGSTETKSFIVKTKISIENFPKLIIFDKPSLLGSRQLKKKRFRVIGSFRKGRVGVSLNGHFDRFP